MFHTRSLHIFLHHFLYRQSYRHQSLELLQYFLLYCLHMSFSFPQKLLLLVYHLLCNYILAILCLFWWLLVYEDQFAHFVLSTAFLFLIKYIVLSHLCLPQVRTDFYFLWHLSTHIDADLLIHPSHESDHQSFLTDYLNLLFCFYYLL